MDKPTPMPTETDRLLRTAIEADSKGLANIKSVPFPTADDSDKVLVEKSYQAEYKNAAFDILWGRHRDKLYGIIYLIVYHREDTLDLLQDTFIQTYNNISTLQDKSKFFPWSATIASNLAINYIKRKERYKRIQEVFSLKWLQQKRLSKISQLENNEIKERIQEAISFLSIEQREAILLCAFGKKYREIADELGIKIGTVMSRIYYARDAIAAMLGPNVSVSNTDTCYNSSEMIMTPENDYTEE